MRPEVDDILAGVQRLLTADLVPALTASPFLVEQTMYAVLVLDYCRKSLPRLHLALAEEHADLHGTLRRTAEHLRDAGAGLGVEITRAVGEDALDVASTPLDVVAERNRELRAWVTRVVALLAEEAGAVAEPSSLSRARVEVDAYLARLAARHAHDLAALGIAW